MIKEPDHGRRLRSWQVNSGWNQPLGPSLGGTSVFKNLLRYAPVPRRRHGRRGTTSIRPASRDRPHPSIPRTRLGGERGLPTPPPARRLSPARRRRENFRQENPRSCRFEIFLPHFPVPIFRSLPSPRCARRLSPDGCQLDLLDVGPNAALNGVLLQKRLLLDPDPAGGLRLPTWPPRNL